MSGAPDSVLWGMPVLDALSRWNNKLSRLCPVMRISCPSGTLQQQQLPDGCLVANGVPVCSVCMCACVCRTYLFRVRLCCGQVCSGVSWCARAGAVQRWW